MPSAPVHSGVLRFGAFELDSKNGELRKSGSLVRLKPQPLKLLTLLVSQAGDVVARDDIQQRLWGSGTFIDFDQGVNHCIRQIRVALSDDAVHPRYVQTLPRRGYRFLHTPQTTDPAEGTIRPGHQNAERLVLAVLPFENLSGDSREDYVSYGLTDELITQLGRAHPEALGVVSRCSIKRYRDCGKPVAEVGQELGADYIVEGSVRKSVDRVRVCAQLVDARHQTHLWAAPYERTLGDVLAMQCDVAQAITEEIRLALSLKAESRSSPEQVAEAEPGVDSSVDRTSVVLSWEARRHCRGKETAVSTRARPTGRTAPHAARRGRWGAAVESERGSGSTPDPSDC